MTDKTNNDWATRGSIAYPSNEDATQNEVL